jgi:SPP1 gp7 family putative phage head morphogenesis protein
MAKRTAQGQLLHDVVMRYQVYLERLKAGEVKKVDPVLRQIDAAVREALSGIDGTNASQVVSALRRLRVTNQQITDRYIAGMSAELKRLSAYATEFHAQTLGLVWPAAAPALVTPAVAAVWAATLATPVQATGALLEPFVQGWSGRTLERVEGAIRLGYAQGRTTDEIIRTVRGTKAANFSDGILAGTTKRDAAAVVRTAIQQVSNQAQQAVYTSNEDIVEGYEWVSTLDMRTSSQCRSLDGLVFKLGKGPVPPAHISCRSTTVPKLTGIDLNEGSTRASKGAKGGEQVSAELTYYDWLKKQPASFVEDAIGKDRAQLFRKGGLSADEFARLNLDKNFQPLTLEQMRKKNPAAFARAGL